MATRAIPFRFFRGQAPVRGRHHKARGVSPEEGGLRNKTAGTSLAVDRMIFIAPTATAARAAAGFIAGAPFGRNAFPTIWPALASRFA